MKVHALIVALAVSTGLALPVMAQDTPRLLKRPAPTTAVQPPAEIRTIPSLIQPIPPDSTPAGQPPTPREHTTCVSARDCPTGECWDGICCNATCRGNCVSCALPGHEGICTAVPDGQDPRRACCTSQGGHPACNAVCTSGQCMFPDVGASCGVCSACDGVGRCTLTPGDDADCGVIECSGLDSPCRTYTDLSANRCAALGTCKQANDPAVCVIYADKYAWVDANQVHRECATGKVMNCYRLGTRWVWQDGSTIKDCRNGEVCAGCSPQQSERPEEWTPTKNLDPNAP